MRNFSHIDLISGLECALSCSARNIGAVHLCRMSPVSACSFLLLATTLFILSGKRSSPLPEIAGILSSAMIALNLLIVIGYAYMLPFFYSGEIVSPSFPAALSFIFLGISFLYLAVPQVRLMRSWARSTLRGRLVLAFLPMTLTLFIAEGSVHLWLGHHSLMHPALMTFLTSVITGVLIIFAIAIVSRHVGKGIEKTQNALRLSESRFRDSFDQSPVGSVMVGLDKKFLRCNPAFCTFLGYTEKELIGRTFLDVTYPADAEIGFTEAVQITQSKSLFFSGEKRYQKKDGAIVWGAVSVSAVFDSHDKPLYFLTIVQDITERKRIEKIMSLQHDLLLCLNSCNDMNQAMEKILAAALQFEPLDSGGVYLAGPDENSLDLVFHKGLSPEFIARVSHYDGDSPRMSVVRKGETFYGTYASLLPDQDPVRAKEKLRGFAIIPIKSSGRLVGVLNLASHTHDDIPVAARNALETMAFQIGSILMRLRSDVALRESEKIFNVFMENSPVYVFFKDDKIRPIRLSRNYEKMLGRPVEELLGKSMYELFPSPLAKSMVEDDLRILHEGRLITVDENYNGRYYTTMKFPISIEGKPRYLAGYTIDITDRKLADAAIAAEKERLAVTLRSIGDGVITTDTNGTVVLINKVAEQLTGWTQSEAEGKPIRTVFNLVNESTREPCENPVEKVLSSGRIIELANHTLLISRDGSERIIADSGAPIKNAKSVTIGVVLVFRDMTEKQKMLDGMQRVDKLNSIGVLAGGIAHDFNNLLSGLFGYINLAQIESSGDAAGYLDKAMSVFNRARDLTRQLLTFSKGGAPKRITGQLTALIKQNADFVLSGSSVLCEFRLAPDLWQCDFDDSQMSQVIDNIVINAKQAMPSDGRIIIHADNVVLRNNEVASLRAGSYVKISITDSGSGIPQNIISRVFDPFFTTKEQGTGLGLATCYSIMQKHDGFIDVESVPGKGSTFHLYLPASKDNQPDAAPAISSPHRGIGRILVMDDEGFVRDVVSELLATVGYSAAVAANGSEAIRLCFEAKETGESFCAAIFDLTIPGGMGGRQALAEVRKIFPQLPVFASSGFSEDPVMAHPRAFGFTDSIRKPFSMDELEALLNRNLK